MGPRRCNNGGRFRQFSDSCGSRRELFNDCFLPQIGFATAVNAPLNFGGDSTHFLNSLLTSRARNTHCFILLPILVSCLSSNLCTVLLWIMHHLSKWYHIWNPYKRSNVVTVGIQIMFRICRSPHAHRSILDSPSSSSFGVSSIWSLLFDVNVLGTRCSLFSRIFFRFYLNRVAWKNKKY